MNIFIFISFILLALACSISATLAVYWHSEYSILKAKDEAIRKALGTAMCDYIAKEVEMVFGDTDYENLKGG
jgi:uncharacterized protein YpmB